MPFRAFISYSREDISVRYAVEAILGKSVDFLFDDEAIQAGSCLWESISHNLNSASCVLAIITESSLKSHWCLEEIIRAHERGIPIVPLCHEDLNEAELPSFIRPLLRIPFGGADLTNILRARVLPRLNDLREVSEHLIFPKRRFRQIYSALDEVEKTKTAFRTRLADAILENVEDELDRVSENYTIDLGLERNFLVRAKAIFSSSKKVYATSIDSISTFWTAEDLRETAHEYIKAQSPHTVRLFVFKDALSAHLHSQVLEAHSQAYGTTGAVLICSMDSYRAMMRSIQADNPDVYENDFAFIETGETSLLAKLDGSRLHFHTLNPAKPDLFFPVRKDRFATLMEDAILTPVGEINEQLRVAQKGMVLRWSSDFIPDRAIWAEKLKELFDTTDVSGGYLHQISLREDIPIDDIVSVRNSLLALKASGEIDFEDVWLGSRFTISVQDGQFGGRIDMGDEDDSGFCLIVRFSSKENLIKYLASKQHSRIRKIIYSTFSEEIVSLYEDAEGISKEGKDASEIFEKIEAAARPFFRRREYAGNERIDDIVKISPRRFLD